jgi:leader peptidase (prepilin peptidase)/N-methyltransferase
MAELFGQAPAVFASVVFFFALLIGSFLNVVIYRLPLIMQRDWRAQCSEIMESPAPELPDGRFNLLVPSSRCPSCGTAIKVYQNIPVLSYLFLRGRCGACEAPISARYPVVEAATAILSALVAWRFGFGWEAGMAIILTMCLVVISLIDFDTQFIPDSIVLPLLWAGLLMSLFYPQPGAEVLFIPSADAIIGAALGYLSLWSFYWLFKIVTGKEGMGYGDFKLLGALGAWLGYQSLFTIIMMSAVVGAVLGIALIVVRGRDRQVPMPFGPFLASAGWLVMMFGDTIKSVLNLPF